MVARLPATAESFDCHLSAGEKEMDDITLDARGTVEWSEESWQFFAFVFAALLTLSFAIVDAGEKAWPSYPVWLSVVVKTVLFAFLGWLTLWCRRFKSFLVVRVLKAIKR
jgi:hypothetical protein